MVFRGRRLSPIWHAILRGGAKRIVRLSSGGNEKPHSSIAPFFSATRRHDAAKKRNNQPRELSAGLCSFFVAAGGRWKLTTPLAESTALFFPPPPPPSLFCPPTSSSSSLLLSRWFIESVDDSSPLLLITRANSALPRLSWRIDFEEKVWKEASVLISFWKVFSTGVFCFSSTVWKFEEKNLIWRGENILFFFVSNTMLENDRMISIIY